MDEQEYKIIQIQKKRDYWLALQKKFGKNNLYVTEILEAESEINRLQTERWKENE